MKWGIILGDTHGEANVALTNGVGTLTVFDSQNNAVAAAGGKSFTLTTVPGEYQALIGGNAFPPAMGSTFKTVTQFTSAEAGGAVTGRGQYFLE